MPFVARRTLPFFLILLLTFGLALAACDEDDASSQTDGDKTTDGDTDKPEAEQDNPGLDDCGQKIVVVPEECTNCHSAPPAGTHPQNTRCYKCHTETVDENFKPVADSKHDNGSVETELTCTSCHGHEKADDPWSNLKGECGLTKAGVGSHPAHSAYCVECHVVPATNDATGHQDGDNKAEVSFSGLALTGGVTPVWKDGKCSSVYCHGATLSGGTATEPTWGDHSGQAGSCGSCHLAADPDGNTEADCNSCHSTSVDKDRKIIPGGTHLNGVKD